MLTVASLGLLLKPALGGSNPSRMLSHGSHVLVEDDDDTDVEVEVVVAVDVLDELDSVELLDVDEDKLVVVLEVVLDEVDVLCR